MRIKAIVASAAAVPFLWAAGSAHAETKILFNAFLPAGHVFNTGILKPWAQAIEEGTQGRVKFEIPPASLSAPHQQWQAVTKGVIDGAYIYNGLIGNHVPLQQIVHLPLGSSSTAVATGVASWNTYQRFFKPAGEYKDVHLLALFAFPCSQLYSLKEPIDSVESLSGVKFWASAGAPAKLLGAANAAVISTPAVRMSEYVSGGQVDGFTGVPDIDAKNFNVVQYAKSRTVLPGCVSSGGFSVILNKKKWDAISPADQQIISRLSGDAFARRLEVMDRANEAALAEGIKGGLKDIKASPQFVEQVRKLAEKLDEAWIAEANKLGVDGRAALNYYRQQTLGN